MIKDNYIKSVMALKNKNANEIAKELEINPQTISNWINNKNLKQINKFIKLLILLDIKITDLYN